MTSRGSINVADPGQLCDAILASYLPQPCRAPVCSIETSGGRLRGKPRRDPKPFLSSRRWSTLRIGICGLKSVRRPAQADRTILGPVTCNTPRQCGGPVFGPVTCNAPRQCSAPGRGLPSSSFSNDAAPTGVSLWGTCNVGQGDIGTTGRRQHRETSGGSRDRRTQRISPCRRRSRKCNECLHIRRLYMRWCSRGRISSSPRNGCGEYGTRRKARNLRSLRSASLQHTSTNCLSFGGFNFLTIRG